MDPESEGGQRSYCNRLEEFCFLKALEAAISTLPRNYDFFRRCFTSQHCPQPWKCVGNSVFLAFYYPIWALMMGPYLIIDTLFVKPKLYRLYKRYLKEGHELKGTILFANPIDDKNCINITLVRYAVEDNHYVKFLAHGSGSSHKDDAIDENDDGKVALLILPRRPKSACSKWTAEMYVERHSYCHCISMTLLALGLTVSVAIGIALSLYIEVGEDVSTTLLVVIPVALFLVCLYLFLRKDPVQNFLLDSAREILPDEELGEWSDSWSDVDEDRADRSVMQPTLEYCSAAEGYFHGVPSQAVDDPMGEEIMDRWEQAPAYDDDNRREEDLPSQAAGSLREGKTDNSNLCEDPLQDIFSDDRQQEVEEQKNCDPCSGEDPLDSSDDRWEGETNDPQYCEGSLQQAVSDDRCEK